MANSTGAAAAEKNYLLLLAAAGVLLFISIAGFFTYQSSVARDQSLLNSARLMVDTLRSLSKTGTDVVNGVPPNFELVQSLAQGFDQTLTAYRGGDSTLGISAMTIQNRAELDALDAAWAPMKAQLQIIQDNAVPYQRVATNIKAINEIVPGAIASYSAVLERTTGENFLLNLQLKHLYRILQLSRQALADGRDSDAAVRSLAQEIEQFQRDHKTVTSSNFIDRASAEDVRDTFATVETAVQAIQQDIKPVATLQLAAESLPGLEKNTQTATEALREKIQGSLGISNSLALISALATFVALLLIGLYVFLTVNQARRREDVSKASEAEQQQSILSLLDEITNIANGDLTGELTVTADFTGNIADSLNFTVQTLRGLVGTINDTSVEIAAAASSTTERVQQMSTSSEGQAREIVRATQAISYGSRSLEEVATRAEKLAEQAKTSVDTAHNGAATVGRTIAGMATLREQIQDTAKRIKRLGESSQEIGNIIEFINDIAEQTNTLALNASIQAAMAGESGRGFAVVADEVQRLAERAASATKQIESLVKTIQADTQEAITSMERSTTNVVGGAKSAEEAGLALTRIEASSQELAKVIQDIAAASRTQSVETTKLATTMQGIREVSVQTSATAHQTAESVGELNVLSAKLRESVSGFKLPMDVSTF
ncbi:MAG: methyl-accepting chemotaxis protein [Stagnimonas sp.]|nr:methyl-accepting chemotaxis protein [Stagnimonas sp.]